MGYLRSISLIISFFLVSPVFASPITLSVWIEDQIYTLELETHAPAGIEETGNARHYKGHISGVHESWARVSLFGNQWEGVVSLHGELHLLEVETGSANARSLRSGVISATPAAAYNNLGACALHERDEAGSAPASRSALNLSSPTAETASFNTLCASTVDGVCLLAEMDFVFDQAFQSDFPADYESRATQLINIMEGYYRNDMDIAFKNLTTTFLSSTVFSNTTDSFALLQDMSAKKRDGDLSFSSKDEALMHLVTGRDFDGSTVGIAWLEGLCDSSGYFSTSTTQVVAGNISLTALVAAHEVGHNLGAAHDGDGNSCGAGFIMAASLDPSASQFSSCSVGYMQDAIGSASNQNACFDYPYDIEITGNNGGSALATSSVTRTFIINAAAASQSINSASISGSIDAGNGNFTAVTIDGSACTIAGDGQSYSCTLSSPGSNHTLSADLTVSTDSYTVQHSVSVSQSQLTETDSGNNSVNDSFTVVLGEGGDGGGGSDTEDSEGGANGDTGQPSQDQEEEQAEAAPSDSGDSGGGSGGGGSAGLLLLLSLTFLLMGRHRVNVLTC